MSARELTRLGLLAGAGLILFLLEAVAPRPLPWMKLGLGNLPVVVALELFGGGAAIAVAVVKIAGGGLVSGGFGSPAFAIGAGAGIASVISMALARLVAPGLFSLVGLSVLGAVTHQLTQLLIARVYLHHPGLLAFLPLFLLSGLVSGFAIGLIAHWCAGRLRRLEPG